MEDLTDDEREEGEFSDSEDERKQVRKNKKQAGRSSKSPGLDFSKLPTIDNGGLTYLPVMQYFNVGEECPLKPPNKLPADLSLNVIITLPNGGFKCLAIPLEAVDEDPNEYVYVPLGFIDRES
jgi:hypothetical protein